MLFEGQSHKIMSKLAEILQGVCCLNEQSLKSVFSVLVFTPSWERGFEGPAGDLRHLEIPRSHERLQKWKSAQTTSPCPHQGSKCPLACIHSQSHSCVHGSPMGPPTFTHTHTCSHMNIRVTPSHMFSALEGAQETSKCHSNSPRPLRKQ